MPSDPLLILWTIYVAKLYTSSRYDDQTPTHPRPPTLNEQVRKKRLPKLTNDKSRGGTDEYTWKIPRFDPARANDYVALPIVLILDSECFTVRRCTGAS